MGSKDDAPRKPMAELKTQNSKLKTPIGLLAGFGRFPIYFAQKARSRGVPLVCVGIRHMADPILADLTDHFYWTGVAQLGRIIRCFKRKGVRELVMAGKVLKSVMYTPWRLVTLWPDWRTIWTWYRVA